MRKHNIAFAVRWGRSGGDRSNFPQSMAHEIANDKQFHLAANFLLRGLLRSGHAHV
jgi:hypothetical protein